MYVSLSISVPMAESNAQNECLLGCHFPTIKYAAVSLYFASCGPQWVRGFRVSFGSKEGSRGGSDFQAPSSSPKQPASRCWGPPLTSPRREGGWVWKEVTDVCLVGPVPPERGTERCSLSPYSMLSYIVVVCWPGKHNWNCSWSRFFARIGWFEFNPVSRNRLKRLFRHWHRGIIGGIPRYHCQRVRGVIIPVFFRF